MQKMSKDEIDSRNELLETAVRDAVRKARKIPVSKKPKRQQLYYVYTMLMNRKTLEYTFTNALMYALWLVRSCRCCPFRTSKSMKLLKAPRADVYMNKAEARISQDLDIVKLIDKMHTVDDLKRNTFNVKEH